MKSLLQFLLAISIVFINALPLCAQGFMVKPMVMEFGIKPNQVTELELKFNNTTTDRTIQLELALIDLDQSDNGAWVEVSESETDTKRTPTNSCKNWVTLEADNLSINPMQESTVKVKVTVPSLAKGFNSAAIIARTRRDPNDRGIGISLRFLIPILITIDGPTPMQRLALDDVGLQFVSGNENTPAYENVFFTVSNQGDTVNQVSGNAVILLKSGDTWRRIASIDLAETRILPKMKFNLTAKSPKRLPSGQYKIDANLSIDGKKANRLQKEIDFLGDSSIQEVAEDIALSIAPQMVEISATPGSRRSGTLTLKNASAQTIAIVLEIEQPKDLKGVMMGEIKGDHYSCHEWLRPTQSKLTLSPGAEKQISIAATYPKVEKAKPFYYATLKVYYQSSESKAINELSTTIILKDESYKQDILYRLTHMGYTLSQSEPQTFMLNIKYGNTGDAYIDPDATCLLTSRNGMKVIKSVPVKRTEGIVLPLSLVQYTGDFSVSNVEDDIYVLNLKTSYNGKNDELRIPVQITTIGDAKEITIIKE